MRDAKEISYKIYGHIASELNGSAYKHEDIRQGIEVIVAEAINDARAEAFEEAAFVCDNEAEKHEKNAATFEAAKYYGLSHECHKYARTVESIAETIRSKSKELRGR